MTRVWEAQSSPSSFFRGRKVGTLADSCLEAASPTTREKSLVPASVLARFNPSMQKPERATGPCCEKGHAKVHPSVSRLQVRRLSLTPCRLRRSVDGTNGVPRRASTPASFRSETGGCHLPRCFFAYGISTRYTKEYPKRKVIRKREKEKDDDIASRGIAAFVLSNQAVFSIIEFERTSTDLRVLSPAPSL